MKSNKSENRNERRAENLRPHTSKVHAKAIRYFIIYTLFVLLIACPPVSELMESKKSSKTTTAFSEETDNSKIQQLIGPSWISMPMTTTEVTTSTTKKNKMTTKPVTTTPVSTTTTGTSTSATTTTTAVSTEESVVTTIEAPPETEPSSVEVVTEPITEPVTEPITEEVYVEPETEPIVEEPPATEETEYVETEASNLTYQGTFEGTWYDSRIGTIGARGTRLTSGYSVASNLFPMGTELYIEGFGLDGYYIVEDTGGMANNVIDFFYDYGCTPSDFAYAGRVNIEVWVVN